MMQSILLPTSPSSLQSKESVSSNESKGDEIDGSSAETQVKKKNSIFSTLLDAAITPKQAIDASAKTLSEQLQSTLSEEEINKDSAEPSSINESELVDAVEEELSVQDYSQTEVSFEWDNQTVEVDTHAVVAEGERLLNRSENEKLHSEKNRELSVDQEINESDKNNAVLSTGNIDKSNKVNVSGIDNEIENDKVKKGEQNSVSFAEKQKEHQSLSSRINDQEGIQAQGVLSDTEGRLQNVAQNQLEAHYFSSNNETRNPANIAGDAKLSQQDDKRTSINSSGEIKPSQAELQPANILAQIEEAQKTNIRISGLNSQAVSGSDKTESENESVEVQDEKKGKLISKSLFEPEKIALKDNAMSNDKASTEAFLKNQAAVVIPDKQEHILTSNQTDKTALTASMDSNSLLRSNHITGTQSDKLNGQPQPMLTMHATSLHDPLSLHAKQNAALLGERVMMMISQDKQEIQIRLDPAELGSMNIKVQVQQDQVQLTIHTQMSQTRDFIEQHLPKLREQLAQQGVNLGEANIEQQSQQQKQQNQQQTNLAHSDSSRSENTLSATSELDGWVKGNITLAAQGIDYYA
ncbi:flagellar hook-length control protein FliK [Psychromonas sp. MME2]|uniref:flagellar hook-length control protein FliK n=1 Tax=unclassified Psychromonas TaxID=2614957 RepID=UPI00339C5CB8